MKKLLLTFLLCAVLILSVGAAAYAEGDYTMTYKPGTADTVTDMPADDSGTGGAAYTVSSAVPQREGYEFLDWTLDYDVATITSYTVRYLEKGTQKVLASAKVEPDQKAGTTVTETAINIDRYNLIGEESQSKKLAQNAEENVTTFYYEERSAFPYPGPYFGDVIQPEPYIVHHVGIPVGELATENGEAMGGDTVTVHARDFEGYRLLPPFSEDDTLTIMPTQRYEHFFELTADSWYRIIPGSDLDLYVDGLQVCCAVAGRDGQYTIWTRDELTDAQKIMVYESFSANVYGMSDAGYENCQFMYADGSTLNGVTVDGDYISFDEKADWSLAIGVPVLVHTEYYDTGADNSYTFFYNREIIRR